MKEKILEWKGIGYYEVEEEREIDFKDIIGVKIVGGIMLIMKNILKDIEYVMENKRVRIG